VPRTSQDHALVGWVILASTGYLAFVLWTGWQELAESAHKVGLYGVAAALALSLVNYGLRFARWQSYLLALKHRVPWRQSLRIYLAGFALTTTPGKAGEAFRSILLRKWGVPYPGSFAALLSERLSDLLAVCLLALAGWSLHAAVLPAIAFALSAIAGTVLILSNKHLLDRLERASSGGLSGAARILRPLLDLSSFARCLHSPGLLAGATALSLAAWAAEAWAFYLLCDWMGVEISLHIAVSIYALAMLAGAASFMPGGLGGAEAAMIALLLSADVSFPDACAATILIRVATLWFAVGIGCLATVFHRRSAGAILP
jgi:uncharacterized membrane protein YbhN (UPF0104 family)